MEHRCQGLNDVDGKPLAGVSFAINGSRWRNVESGKDGGFRIKGLDLAENRSFTLQALHFEKRLWMPGRRSVPQADYIVQLQPMSALPQSLSLLGSSWLM